jgi:uncharacterized protein YgfB (UPF0149 family)
MKRKINRAPNSNRIIKMAFFTVLLLVLSLASSAQTTYYIDPEFTGQTPNGSIENPYNYWSQVNFASGNSYLQKRGTTAYTTDRILIMQNNITLGAYGTGERPKIIKTTGGSHVINLAIVSNCTVRDLDVSATADVTTAIIIATNSGPIGAANNLIDNCVLHDTEWGIRILTNAPGNRILNCTIYNIGDDGIYAKYVQDIEIGYCHIYDVNTKYFTNPDQSYSGGDNIQLASENDMVFNIHNNILDHSSTGNKFCFIAYGRNYTGVIEHNTMIGNSENVTSCIYLHSTTETVNIRYNTLKNGNFGIYSYVNDLQFHYNQVCGNNYGIYVLTNRNLTALNNVFYNNKRAIGSIGGTTVTSKNNIFHISESNSRIYSCSGTIVSDYNNFTSQQDQFLDGYSTLNAWQAATGNDANSFVGNPLFVNPDDDDFCVQPTSPCINKGTNVNLDRDFFGTQVPQAGLPEIGFYEYAGGQSNNAEPIINNQTFSVSQSATNGTLVGTVVASDPDQGQTLTYSITSGNTNNAFALNQTNGRLTVTNSSALNGDAFNLIVRVTDNGTPTLWAQATITINITGSPNQPPMISNQSFSIIQNTANGTLVGTVAASDPDQGQTLTYTIISGNTDGAFALNQSNGRLTVANASAINGNAFNLIVRVTDNGTPALSDEANITIHVESTNNTFTIEPQAYSINENTARGRTVCEFTSPDNPGDRVMFYLLEGNTNNAFNLSAYTGRLSVNNSQALDFESNPVFNLKIRAINNLGTSIDQIIPIYLIDVNEAPIVLDQTFNTFRPQNAGAEVGIVEATDPDTGQTLNYSIRWGETGNMFKIDQMTGMISINNAEAFNSSSATSYNLQVKVQDNGQGTHFTYADVTILIAPSNLNEAPIIEDQAFNVPENSPTGFEVGQILASDPDENQTLSYSIVSGNTEEAFVLTESGILLVNKPEYMVHASNPLFSIEVKVTDNGTPTLEAQATITISITGSPNQAPILNNQTFTVNQNATNGTIAGTVVASDPDQGQTLAYSITSGNTNNAFALNQTNGRLTVANASALNGNAFNLTIRVTDNGTPALWTQATITINITGSPNQAPVINNQTFTINQNAANGTLAGTVVASDPDQGQILTYSIISGNTNNAFALNQSNGRLTVANSSAIIGDEFNLIVRVTDNGSSVLSAEANITIQVNSTNNSFVIEPQAYSINENTARGRTVCWFTTPDHPGDRIAYYLLEGNTNNAFSLTANTGRLSVNNSDALDFETNSVFNLKIRAIDNLGTSIDQIIPIYLLDVNEAPLVLDQSFNTFRPQSEGAEVGIVEATDPDAGQALNYSIRWGETGNIFKIDRMTGMITINNAEAFNSSSVTSFNLQVKVQDNGQGTHFTYANVTISISKNQLAGEQNILPEMEGTTEITAFPNPSTSGIFHIKCTDFNNQEGTLTVLSLTGTILLQKNITGNSETLINLEAMPKGIYILRIMDGKNTYTQKLIRQ